jgi:hypothetical protein
MTREGFMDGSFVADFEMAKGMGPGTKWIPHPTIYFTK